MNTRFVDLNLAGEDVGGSWYLHATPGNVDVIFDVNNSNTLTTYSVGAFLASSSGSSQLKLEWEDECEGGLNPDGIYQFRYEGGTTGCDDSEIVELEFVRKPCFDTPATTPQVCDNQAIWNVINLFDGGASGVQADCIQYSVFTPMPAGAYDFDTDCDGTDDIIRPNMLTPGVYLIQVDLENFGTTHGDCDPVPFTMSVEVVAAPDAGQNASIEVCTDTDSLEFDLWDHLGAPKDTGGSWFSFGSNPDSVFATNGYLGTIDLEGKNKGIYEFGYSINDPVCGNINGGIVTVDYNCNPDDLPATWAVWETMNFDDNPTLRGAAQVDLWELYDVQVGDCVHVSPSSTVYFDYQGPNATYWHECFDSMSNLVSWSYKQLVIDINDYFVMNDIPIRLEYVPPICPDDCGKMKVKVMKCWANNFVLKVNGAGLSGGIGQVYTSANGHEGEMYGANEYGTNYKCGLLWTAQPDETF